ncbi:MAG: hypothetical protein MUF69_09430, partial [Desulfobacterota bacterium]|nr:hypothetical protein [Thermodesulfobacteriota bacterium]
LAKCIFFTLMVFLLSIFSLVANSPAQQNLSVFSCTPVHVGTHKTYSAQNQNYPAKVWVQCNPPFNQFQYFAVPIGSDAAEAARFLSLFTAAFVTGKTIDIGYINNDSSGAAFNCTSSTQCFPAISATVR